MRAVEFFHSKICFEPHAGRSARIQKKSVRSALSDRAHTHANEQARSLAQEGPSRPELKRIVSPYFGCQSVRQSVDRSAGRFPYFRFE